tara:strand:+ start:261 stop:524 length:264 start_codon:yes stop_codon:yes gene_type:complete
MAKRESYTSKGERPTVSRRWKKLMRKDVMQTDRTYNQWDAFIKGKNVVLTIKNPNKNETNKPFIRVPAKEQWRILKAFTMTSSENVS